MTSSPKNPKVVEQLQALGSVFATPDRNKFFVFMIPVQLLVTKDSLSHTCAVSKAYGNAQRNKQSLLFRLLLKSHPQNRRA